MGMFRRFKIVMRMRRKFFKFMRVHRVRPFFLFRTRCGMTTMFRRRLRMLMPGRFYPVMLVRRVGLVTVAMPRVRTIFWSRIVMMVAFRRRRLRMFVPG